MPSAPEGNWREQEERAISMGEARMDEEKGGGMKTDSMITTGVAAESNHWYRTNGDPAYQVPAKNGGLRSVNLRDARKHTLVPSVTSIIKLMAAPGLEIWKQKQVVLSALTLPMVDSESLDDYAARVMADSKQQAIRAAERGQNIHAAIEDYFRGKSPPQEYAKHVFAAVARIAAVGTDWECERSFAHPLGYGGRVDLHSRSADVVLDIKTKEFTENDTKKLVYDEHIIQLPAYRYGLRMPKARCGNVFVSTSVPGLAVTIMHEEKELQRGMRIFRHLLSLWKEIKKFDPSFKGESE